MKTVFYFASSLLFTLMLFIVTGHAADSVVPPVVTSPTDPVVYPANSYFAWTTGRIIGALILAIAIIGVISWALRRSRTVYPGTTDITGTPPRVNDNTTPRTTL